MFIIVFIFTLFAMKYEILTQCVSRDYYRLRCVYVKNTYNNTFLKSLAVLNK